MKMKRSVILSLFAVALTALCATTAQAVVDVQLNLRYDDPADPNQGGTWDLLVQSGATNGVAGLLTLLDGITGVTGTNTPLSAITPNAAVFDDVTSIFKFQPIGVGTEVEIIAGDDLVDALIVGVGTGPNTPGDNGLDDLDNAVWDNSALIASGSFGGTRPIIVAAIANEFANPATDPLVAAMMGDLFVRGDSLVTLGLEDPNGAGLLAGDADRDFDVDIADLGNLAGTLGGAGGWDDGDTDGDGDVDIADLGALAGNLGLTGALPPAIGAVPEPTTSALALAALCLAMSRRRMKRNLVRKK